MNSEELRRLNKALAERDALAKELAEVRAELKHREYYDVCDDSLAALLAAYERKLDAADDHPAWLTLSDACKDLHQQNGEIRKLRTALAEAQAELDGFARRVKLAAEVRELEMRSVKAQLHAAVAVLRKYGRHGWIDEKHDDGVNRYTTSRPCGKNLGAREGLVKPAEWDVCTCGLDAALEAVRDKP